MSVSLIAGLIGGIGLFLLGMHLMTDGLKLAAGSALANMLSRWTGTPLRGLLSGALITAIVQSSSAVTVATIGFVNAGLMRLSQALTVIYGSNVGTTMTGWLVAIVGFHVNVRAFALPAVGIGMLAQLLAGERRIGAFGRALAGFGVFFLGIEALKTTSPRGARPSMRMASTRAWPLVSTGKSFSRFPVCEITASVQLAACTSIPMYRSIGASSRWVLLNSQLENVRRGREAPICAISGAYVAGHRRHTRMMLFFAQQAAP